MRGYTKVKNGSIPLSVEYCKAKQTKIEKGKGKEQLKNEQEEKV